MQVIVAVPERSIGNSFAPIELTKYGFYANWEPNQWFNLQPPSFFAAVCLNLDVYDQSGNRFVPREWFCVPINVINEAIELVLNNTIFNYKYDDTQEKIVLKS